MNWAVFGIFTYVFLVLQTSLTPVLELPTRYGVVGPQFVLLLGVIVGMFAHPRITCIAWAILGLLVDLTSTYALGPTEPSLTLVGPHVLGYLAAAYVMIQLRTMVFKQHPFSTGFAIIVCGVAAELVIVLILSIRGMYDPIAGFSALPQLALRGIGLLYSAVVGVILAVPMLKLTLLFNFPANTTHRPARWGK